MLVSWLLNLAKFEACQLHQSPKPFVSSMASFKRMALNRHLLERFIISLLDLDSTSIKSHPLVTGVSRPIRVWLI
jgi:hypothetical protein